MKNKNIEYIIWLGLREKDHRDKLYLICREIANTEYGYLLSERQFNKGLNNLIQEEMVTSKKGIGSKVIYQRSSDASKNTVELFENFVIGNNLLNFIENESEKLEIIFEFLKSSDSKVHKQLQAAIIQRSRFLLARIKFYAYCKTDPTLPKFMNNEVLTQEERCVELLVRIQKFVSRFDIHFGLHISQTLFKDCTSEIIKISDLLKLTSLFKD